VNPGIFVEILTALQAALLPGLTVLRPILLRLIGVLVFIEILRLVMGILFARASITAGLIRLVLRTTVLLAVFFAFPAIANGILQSFTTLGLLAGGNTITMAQFLDPGAWADIGFTSARPLLDAWGKTGTFTGFTLGLFYLFAWLVFVGAYLYMGLSLFVLQIQFSLTLVGSQVLVAFAATRWTSWMAQGAVAYPINVAFRFFVKAVLASVVYTLLKNLTTVQGALPTDMKNLQPALLMVVLPFVFAVLFWKSDAIAAGLLSGAPALTAGTLVQAAAGGVVLGSGVGGLALGTAGTGLGLAGRGGTAMLRGASATSTAYQIGSATSTGGTIAQIGGGIRGVANAGAGLASSYARSFTGPTMSHLRSTMQAGRQAGWIHSGGTLPSTRQQPTGAGQTFTPSRGPSFSQQLRSTLQTTAFYFGNDQGHGGVQPPL
jgi:type IV secretion system protein TrbL